MKITFAPKGVLQIDDARIVYRNFKGEGTKFNREGDRNFAIVIPDDDMAEELLADGWNVKIKPPREDGDEPFRYLPVKIKFNGRGPTVYLQSGRAKNQLSEDSIDVIDDLDIMSVDLDVRPYDWDVNGKEGRTAYLVTMKVNQQVDRFADDDYE